MRKWSPVSRSIPSQDILRSSQAAWPNRADEEGETKLNFCVTMGQGMLGSNMVKIDQKLTYYADLCRFGVENCILSMCLRFVSDIMFGMAPAHWSHHACHCLQVPVRIDIMRSLRHPHIVELHFSFQDESHVYLGSLFAEYASTGKFTVGIVRLVVLFWHFFAHVNLPNSSKFQLLISTSACRNGVCRGWWHVRPP